MPYGSWIDDLPTGSFYSCGSSPSRAAPGLRRSPIRVRLTFDKVGTDQYVDTLQNKDRHGTVIVQ